MPTREFYAARSRAGVAARTGTPEEASAARRDFAAERISEYVRRTVAGMPPLTDEQCAKVAELLRPSTGGASGA